jgi:hypothetical protein
MRIPGLLVVMVFGLVSVCAAGDQARQSSSSPAAATSFNPDVFNSAAGIVRPDFSGLTASDRGDRDHRRLDPARDGELTCYTIDSYLVKRQSPDSDVTEPTGHSTCQRASRYSVKKAEEAGKAPSH